MLRSMVDTLMDVINIHNGLNIRSMAVTEEYRDNIRTLADVIDSKTAINHIREITAVLSTNAGYSLDFAAQIAILKLVNQKQEENLLEKRIEALEQEISLLRSGIAYNKIPEETENATKEKEDDPLNCNSETEEEMDSFIGASYNPVPFDESDAFVPCVPDKEEPVEAEKIIAMEAEKPEIISEDNVSVSEKAVEIPGGTIVRKETETLESVDSAEENMDEDDCTIAFDDFSSFGKLSFGGWARQN